MRAHKLLISLLKALASVYLLNTLMVITIVLSFPSLSSAKETCADLFLIKDNSLDQLVELENLILKQEELLYKEVIMFKDYRSAFELDIAKARDHFDIAFENFESNNSKAVTEMKYLETLIKKIQDRMSVVQNRSTNTSFEGLIEDPRWMRSEVFYKVNGMDPNVERVLFSQDVVESIFWKTDDVSQFAAQLIFRALLRGRAQSTEKSGVESYAVDRSVYKIKIIGDHAGYIRLAGFFEGKDFYVVDWQVQDNHTPSLIMRVINHVNEEHRRRFPGRR